MKKTPMAKPKKKTVAHPGESSTTMRLHKMEFPAAKFPTVESVSAFLTLEKFDHSASDIVSTRRGFIVKGVDAASLIPTSLKAVTDTTTGVTTIMGKLTKSATPVDEDDKEEFVKGEAAGDEPEADAEGEEAEAEADAADGEDAEAEGEEEAAAEGEEDAEGAAEEEVAKTDSMKNVVKKFDSWAARDNRVAVSLSDILDSNPDPAPPGLSDVNAAMQVALSNVFRTARKSDSGVNDNVDSLLAEYGVVVKALAGVFLKTPVAKREDIAKSLLFAPEVEEDADEEGEDDAPLSKAEQEEIEQALADSDKVIADLRKSLDAVIKQVEHLNSLEPRVVTLESARVSRRQSTSEVETPTAAVQKSAKSDDDVAFERRLKNDAMGVKTQPAASK